MTIASIALFLLASLPGTALADTYTANYGLVLPTLGSSNWGVKVSSNFINISTNTAGVGLTNTFTGSSNTFVGPILARSSVNASAFFGDGSQLTNTPQFNGGYVANTTTFQSSVTIKASAFSVGYSTFVVTSGMVGIGVNPPTQALDVYGAIQENGGILTSSGPYSTFVPNARGSGANDLLLGKLAVTDIAAGSWSTLLGGYNSSAIGNFSAVVGGRANGAGDDYAFVGGGRTNVATGQYSFIGGGQGNQSGVTGGPHSSIVGGQNNQAQGDTSFVGGGQNNVAKGDFSTIGGGNGNLTATSVSSNYSTVGGGNTNSANNTNATIGGGANNLSGGSGGTVGGGDSNSASGLDSTVPGGLSNTAAGSYAFAAGRRAKANANGSFVLSDSQNSDLTGSTSDQLLARFQGGISLQTTSVTVSGELDVRSSSVNASAFFGDGSHLTGISGSASGISTGVVTTAALSGNGQSSSPLGVLSSSVPVLNSSGFVPNFQIDPSSIAKQGSYITASGLQTGVLYDASGTKAFSLSSRLGQNATGSTDMFDWNNGYLFSSGSGRRTEQWSDSLLVEWDNPNAAYRNAVTWNTLGQLTLGTASDTIGVSVIVSSSLAVNSGRFSVGSSSFSVYGGSATVAYLMTAKAFSGDGSSLTGIGSGQGGISTGAVTTAALTGNGNSSSPLGVNSSSVPIFQSGAYPAASGAAITSLTPGNISAGVATNVTGLGSQAQALNMNSHLIDNVTDPASAQDAATKNYVDTNINGLDFKAAGRVATTAALPANTYSNGSSGVGATLTGLSLGALTVDGTVTVAGDRVLVKNEVTAANNGIYSVTTSGAGLFYVLTRTIDFNTASEMADGVAIFIDSGVVNSATGWVTIASVTTVGTDPVTFVQFTGLGDVTAGSGLTKSGNTLSVDSSSVAVLSGGFVLNSQIDPSSVTKQGFVTLANLTGTVPTGKIDLSTVTTQFNAVAVSTTNLASGSATTYLLVSGANGMTGQFTTASTATIKGSAFSVGGSSFSVSGGSATVAYRLTANTSVRSPIFSAIVGGGNSIALSGNDFTGAGPGIGGSVSITGGLGEGGNNSAYPGGDITSTGGNGQDGSRGGNVALVGGNLTGTTNASQSAGAITLTAGSGMSAYGTPTGAAATIGGAGTGDGGNISMTAGTVGTGGGLNAGTVSITGGSGGSLNPGGNITLTPGAGSTIGNVSVNGPSFSVGTSSFSVSGGSATVAYAITAKTFIGDGSNLTGVAGTFSGGTVANATTFQSSVTVNSEVRISTALIMGNPGNNPTITMTQLAGDISIGPLATGSYADIQNLNIGSAFNTTIAPRGGNLILAPSQSGGVFGVYANAPFTATSSVTIQGSAFSIGGSTFTISGGSATFGVPVAFPRGIFSGISGTTITPAGFAVGLTSSTVGVSGSTTTQGTSLTSFSTDTVGAYFLSTPGDSIDYTCAFTQTVSPGTPLYGSYIGSTVIATANDTTANTLHVVNCTGTLVAVNPGRMIWLCSGFKETSATSGNDAPNAIIGIGQIAFDNTVAQTFHCQASRGTGGNINFGFSKLNKASR